KTCLADAYGHMPEQVPGRLQRPAISPPVPAAMRRAAGSLGAPLVALLRAHREAAGRPGACRTACVWGGRGVNVKSHAGRTKTALSDRLVGRREGAPRDSPDRLEGSSARSARRESA